MFSSERYSGQKLLLVERTIQTNYSFGLKIVYILPTQRYCNVFPLVLERVIVSDCEWSLCWHGGCVDAVIVLAGVVIMLVGAIVVLAGDWVVFLAGRATGNLFRLCYDYVMLFRLCYDYVKVFRLCYVV
jgi:hypothetical protein